MAWGGADSSHSGLEQSGIFGHPLCRYPGTQGKKRHTASQPQRGAASKWQWPDRGTCRVPGAVETECKACPTLIVPEERLPSKTKEDSARKMKVSWIGTSFAVQKTYDGHPGESLRHFKMYLFLRQVLMHWRLATNSMYNLTWPWSSCLRSSNAGITSVHHHHAWSTVCKIHTQGFVHVVQSTNWVTSLAYFFVFVCLKGVRFVFNF